MSKLQSINPSNYTVLGEVEISSPEEIREKVRLAREAHASWKGLSIADRVRILRQAFEEFKNRKEEFSLLESREMGMPINEALLDYEWTLDFAHWYFDHAEEYLSPETTFENENELHQVFYEPIGVAAVIVPWNFPFANFVWGALQSLIAGNMVVFKHSEEVPLSGKFLENVLTKYLPQGVFNEIYGNNEVGKLLVQQDINMIAFTGSTKTGKYLYEQAGKKFIKAVMELGGSAPGIVFEDADIDATVGSVCGLRLLNAGQCCDGLKRLIVHESILSTVIERLVTVFLKKKIGNAEEKDTEIGPLVAKRQLELLKVQVEDARSKGARVMIGGNSLEEKFGGAFFEPTVLTNIIPEMRVWNEEVFGPVLPIVTFKTEQEAIDLANQTQYGLGSFVYSKDVERAERVAHSIQTGMVGINGIEYTTPFNPFGGYKSSGFGREHGRFGFHEVTHVKLIAKNK